jgi:hypothetical protein
MSQKSAAHSLSVGAARSFFASSLPSRNSPRQYSLAAVLVALPVECPHDRFPVCKGFMLFPPALQCDYYSLPIVPAVYDVFASLIRETAGFQGLQKCGWRLAREWSVYEAQASYPRPLLSRGSW